MNFYRNRYSYWSDTRFSNWLLSKVSIKKPKVADSKGWNDWTAESQQKSPFMYKLVDEWFDKAQDIVMFPYDVYCNVSRYLKNRYVTKTHLIGTGLEVGLWHEVDTCMLHGMFTLLVDFVEVQKSHMWQISMDGLQNRKRSREYGLAYLDWEMTLEHERQASRAREIRDLYIWWKDVRYVREDAYIISGWSDYCDKHDGIVLFDRNEEERTESRKLIDIVSSIEEKYQQEDTDMLIKLVEIRESLWT